MKLILISKKLSKHILSVIVQCGKNGPAIIYMANHIMMKSIQHYLQRKKAAISMDHFAMLSREKGAIIILCKVMTYHPKRVEIGLITGSN